uniref:EGF-like domain-containing protein n=1 Tax=Meloidogyne hapla TaxID=6305 RepID=A0A1I8C1X3_MELHA
MNNTQNINSSSFPSLSIQPLGDLRIFGVSSRLVYEGSPCDAFPCWNGGICIELRKRKNLNLNKKYKQEEKIKKEGKKYFCKCGKYFGGEHCEERMVCGNFN